jgi:hypothetical protein
MDRFLKPENIERYRRLAGEFTNDAERLQILKVLAAEEARFKLALCAAFAVAPVPDPL